MICTICPNWHECASTYRIGSYCYRMIGDGMVEFHKIKEQWGQSNKDKTSI